MAQQTISRGTVAGDRTGENLFNAFTKANANFDELYGRVANAADYGAVADGSTSLHTAIASALSAGVRTLVLDEGATFYNLASAITPVSGFSIVAGRGRPTIKWSNVSSSRLITASGISDFRLRGLAIDGNKSVTPTDASLVFSGNCTRIGIDDCTFLNLPGGNTGGVVFSTGTTRSFLRFSQFDDCEGTALGINSGNDNIVAFNQFRNSGGWAIGLQGTSAENLISGNNSSTSTLEAYVTQYACRGNRVINNHCDGTGDNGISISGHANVVTGNKVRDTLGCGIGVWGSENSITGNVIKNSNNTNATVYAAGIWAHAQYGGTGSFNTITGNVCDDDQATPTMPYGIRLHGNGYTAWAQGQVVSSLTDFNQIWRRNGLNIYLAQSLGTAGATPPTHTSGTVSDGGVDWLYVNSFTTDVGTLWNTVSANVVRRYKTAAYYDADNWSRNVLLSDTTTSFAITADGLVRARPS